METPSEAIEYAGFVMLHCAVIADGNRNGELICPFAVLQDSEGRQVVNFESETQGEAVEKGWASLEVSQKRGEWWAFGREGLFRRGQETVDVLLVSVWIPGMRQPVTLSQTFARAPDASFYLHGGAVFYIGGREDAELVENWDVAAFYRGISSHPKGDSWAAWSRQ